MSRRARAARPPRQTPYKRAYPSGRTTWIARYYDLDGKTRYAKPRWNGGKSAFARKGDAQRAIDEALERLYGIGAELAPERIGDYYEGWLRRHPRSPRTDKTNADRVSYVLDVEIEGRALGDWEFDELRRRQALALLDHMLRVQGRAAEGARGILRALSAMAEDAIGDDVATRNAFIGIRLRGNDPRVRKPPRKPRIWTFEQMRAFAIGGRPEVRAKTRKPTDTRTLGRYETEERFYPPHDFEALILTPGFTGLRLGELLALKRARFDGKLLLVETSAHEGELVDSSEEKNHERAVPVPPTLAELIERRPPAVDTDLLFPTPRGRLWRERNFYRDVWVPAQLATGMDPTPHEFRHSYVSHLRAAGVDDADLARVAGHTIETMISVYTHPLDRSHEQIRGVIG
jgi:integrase